MTATEKKTHFKVMTSTLPLISHGLVASSLAAIILVEVYKLWNIA
jgi:hypothetical protein